MLNKNIKKINKKQKKRSIAQPDRRLLIQAYGPLVSSQSFQPRWMRCSMKYCDQFLVTLAAGVLTDQIYRANSMFDPDRTGVGHQPRGFDQLVPMYNRYRVNKLSWNVRFTGSANAFNACVLLVNGAQVYTTIVDAGESSLKSAIRGSTSGGNTTGFNGKSDLWRVQGRSEVAYHTDDTTAALVTANPVETIDLHIVLQNPVLTTEIINYVVTLIYDVIFFDQIIPGQS